MDMAPLLEASFAIRLHTAAAVLAAAFGLAVLALRKGTASHRFLGYCFAIAIVIAAMSSFWIAEISSGRFSPIHALSAITLVSVPLAIVLRRRGHIRAHALALIGLVVAGAATLLPGRIIHRIFFG